MLKFTDILKEILEEEKKKADRCKRIADRKFDKPSAYKSGAIVRCRKGDIWKDLKENISTINYKNIEFGQGIGDKLFDYYYPDLSSIGVTQDQMDNTYLATNRKRHLHINLDPSLQGKGLAADIIKAFIYREGYRVIPKGRITNPDMIKVLDKINQDPKFSVIDDGDEYIIDEKYSFNEINLKEQQIKNLKVYHSTNDKFEDFSLDYTWDGFWFTDNINALKNQEVGAAGGKYIMTRYITLNNPAGWDEYDKYSTGELIKQGYDGVILPEDDRIDYLVFNPESISKNINEDESLHKWFKRQGAPGKEGGWVDCNAPIRKDGKITGYKSCGRKEGEKRSKYPSCRPTAAKCKDKGKGTKWGKTK